MVSYSPTVAGTNSQVIILGGGAGTSAALIGMAVAPSSAAVGSTILAGDGILTAPFVLTNGYLFQPVETISPTMGGRAAYSFIITNSGSYVIEALVNAPGDGNNSFFINLDAEPLAPTMIWDIPLTSGFAQRIVSWRGNGSDVQNQFAPQIFTLAPGIHQLILRGREANAQLQSLSIVKIPNPPRRLRFVAGAL